MNPTLPLLIVISAPSGGGKTTLCDQLLAKHTNITRAVTCTTRCPRPGEQQGVDYHFLSRDAFLEKVRTGEFLEHALVYQNFYGTLNSEVLASLETGRHVLLNIDVQGAEAVRQAARSQPLFSSRLVSVFLTPAKAEDLERRLIGRKSETRESLQLRLSQAAIEVGEWRKFDYLIISTTIQEDLRRLEVIIEAELMRQQRARAPLF